MRILLTNDDGINDVFKANFHKDIEILEWELLVFDRWGDLMWHTKNIEDSWDGHFRGKMKQTGVYVWYFKKCLLGFWRPLADSIWCISRVFVNRSSGGE